MDMMGDNESLPRSPWLLMSDANSMYDGNERQITNLSSQALEVPALLGKRIHSSCQEWLLLTSTTSPGCSLLNLFSKETIQLPSVYFSYDFCILSSPPTDPDCRVVFFNKMLKRLMVCQPGDGKYAQHVWNYDRFPCRRYTIVAGKVYIWCGTTLDGCLVSLEFEGSTYRLSVMDMNFVSPIKSNYVPYLVECSGEIFLCLYCLRDTHHTGFQIFKADLANIAVEVTSIGAHTFFLADGMCSSMAEVDSTTFKPNSIYFIYTLVPILYAYDLGKGVTHMYPTFYNSIWWGSQFDWIMMPHNWSFAKILKRKKEKKLHRKRTSVRMIKEGLDRRNGNKKRTHAGIIKEEGLDSLWSSLPLDILILIGSYLFSGDYVRLLAVCKSWQLLGAQYRVPPSLAQEYCSPLLMFQENPSAHTIPVYRFFDPVKSVSYCIEIPVLRKAKIWYSSEGWLLVSRRPGRFYFFNPLTQQRGPALVTAPFTKGKVRIFQWNKGWKKMHNVNFGDKEMFLSRKSWLLEKIEGGGMGKTIFFPLIDDEDDGGNDGIFYSFVTHRYHSFYSGYSCTVPYFVGKPAGGVWVKPVRTRFDGRNLKWH